MKTRDGVVLRADVYRPVTDGPVPAILLRTPYDNVLRAAAQPYLPPSIAARHGFGYIVQDTRGRYRSQGDWEVISPEVEFSDGYDTVEWVASLPWCSGKVGMIGVSYDSFNQFAAAVTAPPHLAAIAPNASGYGGAGFFPVGFALGWSALMARDWLESRADLTDEEAERYAVVIDACMAHPAREAYHLPLSDLPLAKIPVTGDPVGTLLRRANGGTRTGAMPFELTPVPALLTNAYYDGGAWGSVQQFRLLRDKGATEATRRETRLMLGPWTHGILKGYLGEANFGLLADQLSNVVVDYHLAFFARHLQDRDDAPVLPVVRYFVLGANEWRDADEWPPPGTQPTVLHLHAGGWLRQEVPSSDDEPDEYHYDPQDPVPALGGRQISMSGMPMGPIDQRRIEGRHDVLVFSTSPLEDDFEIAGDVGVRLFVSTSTPDTDFFARLCDVDADGVSLNIADGIVRMKWRNDTDVALPPLSPAEVYEVDIPLGPVANQFWRGHRIRLYVTSSFFPEYDRNMNTGNPIGADVAGVVAIQRIYHDADRPSSVTIPRSPSVSCAGGAAHA